MASTTAAPTRLKLVDLLANGPIYLFPSLGPFGNGTPIVVHEDGERHLVQILRVERETPTRDKDGERGRASSHLSLGNRRATFGAVLVSHHSQGYCAFRAAAMIDLRQRLW